MARYSPEESVRREMAFEKDKLCKEDRSVELSFSSEMAVSRGDFDEVLSHEPEEADFSRLNNAHPLLLNHDPDKQIGVVEKARLDPDKRGRAVVRFSKSTLGEEIWKDVQDGIRRLVSVGYRRTKEVSTEKKEDREIVRFAWQPYEISIVSIPADASVGIGRAEPTAVEAKHEVKIMSENVTPDPVAEERKRVSEIRAGAKLMASRIPGINDLSDRAVDSGMSIDQFRAEALKLVPTPEAAPTVKPLDVPKRDIAKYSLSRAIAQAAEGRLTGIERELSDELTNRQGSPKGMFWLPYEAMTSRALQAEGVATASAGGNLKATELWGDEFIYQLKNRMLTGKLGARMLTGLKGDIAIPRGYHATVAAWKTEVEAAVVSDYGIQQLSLAPKGVTAKSAYSKQLLIQGVPSIDDLLRRDLTEQIALAIDLAALHGAGSGGEPAGIYGGTGVCVVTLSGNGANFNTLGLTAVAAIVSLETTISASNADVSTMAFVTNAKVRGALRAQPANTNASTFVWTNSQEPGVGSLIGYPAYVSNQVYSDRTVGSHTTASTIFFGDWSQLIMAFWGNGLDILVDPYSSAGTREILIYASQYADVGLRHPESFSHLIGIEAG